MFAAGVAIGAGWQSLVAFVNIGSYYLVGLPLAAVFGFKLKLNATVRQAWKMRCCSVFDGLPSSKAIC